jgi:hypothetical protein
VLDPDPFGLALHELAVTEKAARRRERPASDGYPASIATDPFGDAKVITDTAGYVAGALDRGAKDLALLLHGERNDGLNAVAYSLGHLVGAGLLDYDVALEHLEQTAENLWPDRDAYNVNGTVKSGLSSGMSRPLEWVQGERTPRTPDNPSDPFDTGLVAAPATQMAQPGVDPVTDEVVRTSWWPRELGPVIRGEVDPEPPPAFLERSDTRALFYAGKVNGLIGESESGKTWVALIAVAQTLKNGKAVLYLDFEDTAKGIVGRLRSLGVDDNELELLRYISPDENLHAVAERDLKETLAAMKPALVVVDGYNAAMTLLGLNLENNTEVTAFSMRVLRPMARTGACVVTIDHVTKSKDTRGNYAIGAQAKRADVDGCLIIVEVTQPFGRGQTGRLKLTVSKDRPGHVRAVSREGKGAGEAILRSAATGDIVANIAGPDMRPENEVSRDFRPTVLMQRVSDFLQAMTEPATRTAVRDNVFGKSEQVLKAVDVLVAEGFLRVNGSGRLVWLKQYRQDQDVRFDPLTGQDRSPVPDRSFSVPGNGTTTVPSFPLPIGERGTASESGVDGANGLSDDERSRERYV